MESTDDYLRRKQAELDYLRGLLERPPPRFTLKAVSEVVEQKIALRGLYLAELALAHAGTTETRWRDGDVEFAGHRLRYGYQRFDLQVRAPPVYPRLAQCSPKPLTGVAFTSAGMSAIAAVVLSLQRILRSAHIVHTPGAYRETVHLIREYACHLETHEQTTPGMTPPSGAPVVLLLDSFAPTPPIDALKSFDGPVDLVLFDTTCYSLDSPKVLELADVVLQRGLPVVLLRSHIKLDSLALEFGRLGSAVFAISPQRANIEALELFEHLVRVSRETVRILGAAPVPLHLAPARHAEFHRLNEARIARIIKNTERVATRLSKTLGSASMETYHHGLFVAIQPPGGASPKELVGVVRDLIGSVEPDSALPVCHAGSFGFDFIAVDEFFDTIRERAVVRISPSDLPTALVDEFAERVTRWWQRSAPDSP